MNKVHLLPNEETGLRHALAKPQLSYKKTVPKSTVLVDIEIGR